MAQNAQPDNLAPVGAVGNAGGAAPTQQTAATGPAQPTAKGNQAPPRDGGADVANAPAENLDLTVDAQRDLEQKKLEEQKKLQQQIDQLEQEIEDTKTQLTQAEEAHDKGKIATLTDQLHGLQTQLGDLLDKPAIQQQNRGPQLIPAPPAGFGGGNGGGFNPYVFGNPSLGMPAGIGGGTGGLSAGNFAPPADPSVTIPDHGRNANKAQIGEMLDAASKKYGIPPNILKAVAWQESGWNQNALSFDGQHGKGVMQIDDRFHQFARTQDVFDPAKNIDYGANYLASLYQKTGSWSGALKSYNGGGDYPPKVLALAEQAPWQKYA